MKFSNLNPDEEMSMEDILSSIRKYVSEEDEKRAQTPQPPEYVPEDPEKDMVIKLGESDMADSESVETKTSNYRTQPSMTYEEKSDIAEDVYNAPSATPAPQVNPEKRKNPFGMFAEALSSNKAKKYAGAPTIDQFFTKIATEVVEAWAEKNLERIVEQVITREIEKIKSE